MINALDTYQNSKILLKHKGSKIHVLVAGGGFSSERQVSLVSAQAITQGLVEMDYSVTLVDVGLDIGSVILDLKPDVVFNGLHGTYGEDGSFPGLLNLLSIPYTHSGLFASSCAFNKLYSKKFFSSIGIPVIPDILVSKNQNFQPDITKPYVIKPLCQGSSIGVKIIFPEDNFSFESYDFPYGEKVFIEPYIKSRELQVTILDGEILGILEVQPTNSRFYDYEAKYTPSGAIHIIDPVLPSLVKEMIYDFSIKSYHAIGCRGIVRTEYLYNEKENNIYLLELNTHPGFTPTSICPEIAAYAGIEFNDLLYRIIALASFDH